MANSLTSSKSLGRWNGRSEVQRSPRKVRELCFLIRLTRRVTGFRQTSRPVNSSGQLVDQQEMLVYCFWKRTKFWTLNSSMEVLGGSSQWQYSMVESSMLSESSRWSGLNKSQKSSSKEALAMELLDRREPEREVAGAAFRFLWETNRFPRTLRLSTWRPGRSVSGFQEELQLNRLM